MVRNARARDEDYDQLLKKNEVQGPQLDTCMLKQVSDVGKVVRRRGSRNIEICQLKLEKDDFEEQVPIGCRKKAKRRPPVTVYEKIEIVHGVVVKLEK